jgi:8-oxo-dGTP pyrophosphatase MutT (NUDIX family)
MPHEISAGTIVYYEDKSIKYLILQHEEGHWDLPKGHVEKNETLEDTAKRETKEETGLDVEIKPGFKESFSYFYRNHGAVVNKTVYFFIAKSLSKKVKLSFEHKDYKWLSFENALENLTYDNAKQVLKKAHILLTQKTLNSY